MDLYEKSLNILELPAVLNMLSGEAVSQTAKEAANELLPSDNIYEIQDRLKETTDAKRLISLKGTPPFTAVSNIKGSLSRAVLGGMLNTRELLEIASVLRAARQLRSWGGELDKEENSLKGLFNSLTANKFLEEKISLSILGEDEIADAASTELANIRRHMRTANAKIREVLQRIITSQAYSKVLQEPIITMRSDRYVIPVKAEHKGSMNGLVHDISSSGQTVFIEPMQVVEANNEIRELQAKEKKEIERILMELSSDAASFEDDIVCDFNILTRLDLIFAKAKLSYLMKADEPQISETGAVNLKRARHPLLDRKVAVPIDIAVGDGFDTLIITGPNTGGKTVSLKTLGLLCLMAQCGLHIPADWGSRVPVFKKVLADIGDEQSIEQSLSTFSSHMRNIVGMLKEAGEGTLMLFDELGAGTDPSEGAALAIAIIEYGRSLGAKIAATTHYAELKVFATAEAGVMNASCEFDVETLRPTYRLLMGIPGKSNAFEISRRLGLGEEIIEDARNRMDTQSADFENVVALLQKERQIMEREQTEASRLRLQAEEEFKKAEEYRRRMEAEKEKAGLIAKREAERLLREVRRTSEEVFAELNEMRKNAAKAENVQQMNEARVELVKKLNAAEEAIGAGAEEEENINQPSSRPVRPGDTVEIIKIGKKAEVISVSPDRVLTLQAGIMRVTAKESEVRLLEGEVSESRRYIEKSEAKLRTLSVSPEIDLRGMTGEEAVTVMERYLDSAKRANLLSVRVIHGKGTGALRIAVQNALKKNPLVKSFRLGHYGEGETGVTVVDFDT
jgi:DNA mismatch repair protein MutS2